MAKFDPKKRTRWGLERGNIDLKDRPSVRNKDGSISTVRSASSRQGNKEVLFPTVADPSTLSFGTKKSKNARVISTGAAAALSRKTGKHLGKFRTPAQADQFARTLHTMQDKMYSPKRKPK